MVASSPGSASAEVEQKHPTPAHCGPMTQQGAMGAHGHQMYPQEFLQLIGCHEAGKQTGSLGASTPERNRVHGSRFGRSTRC
jgi:hypothetical protein